MELNTGGSIKDRIANPLSRGVKPAQYKPDFVNGLLIQEYVDGKEGKKDYNKILLVGNTLPKGNFEFGGKQRIVKDYYPGNSEPVVHVLGPEDGPVTIKGTLKEKRFPNTMYAGFAEEMQKQINAMRIRGNMVRITLGLWKRYGFIEEANFVLKQINNIDYTITFQIIGVNPPKNHQKIKDQGDNTTYISQSLISQANAFNKEATSMPSSMPMSIGDAINAATSAVAGVVAVATGYIDTVLNAAEDIGNAINRAVGLVKYAQLSVLKYKKTLGKYSWEKMSKPLSPGSVNKFKKNETVNQYKNFSHVVNMQGQASSLNISLAAMLATLTNLRKTSPLARYRTVKDDTLQKIAIKFYNDASYWEKIYDHNNLTNTVLAPGTFLEIPRV